MANFANLKAAINAVIKANGQREITGEVMNQVLTAMVNSLGSNYQFAGVATPSTNPGTPDQNVFYMATQAGTYTNFSAIVLQAGISILLWNGSWSSETFFMVDSVPTAGSNNFITSGAVFDKFKLDGGAYDVTAHNNNATFADLSALLNSENLNTLIPVAVRHGGMSIKFVQSSDNKYVQYRYMQEYENTTAGNNAFVNPDNWYNDYISISLNNITGHTDIKIGDHSTPVPSINEINYNLYSLHSWDKVNCILGGQDTIVFSAIYKSLFIPVKSGSNITILGNDSNHCIFALLKTKPDSTAQADYATGSSRQVVLASQKNNVIVPNDANYLYISYESSGSPFYPKSLMIDDYDFMYNIHENIVIGDIKSVEGVRQDLLNENQYLKPITTRDRLDIFLDNNNVYQIAQIYQSLFIPCDWFVGCSYEILTKDNIAIVAFVKSNDYQSEPVYASGESRKVVGNNSKITGVIPSDAKYLYVSHSVNGQSFLPHKIIFNGTEFIGGSGVYQLELISNNSENIERINGLLYSPNENTLASCFIVNNNTWLNGDRYKAAFIPCNGGETYKVRSNGTQYTLFSFLKDNSHVDSAEVNYATGASRVLLGANSEMSGIIPDDAKFIYLCLAVDENSWIPQYFIVDGFDVANGIIGDLFNLINITDNLEDKINYLSNLVYETEEVNLSDYLNLRDCLDSITPSSTHRYIVNIAEGEYDIKSYFTSEEISAPYFRGLYIPDYVTLRGIGRKEYTILKWYNEDDDRSDMIATLNLRNVCGLENLTINSQNIRYTVHDDFAVRDMVDEKRCFNIDVNHYKGVYNAAWGAGQKGNQTANFECCNFYSDKNNKAWSSHNNENVNRPSYIRFKNCTFKNGTLENPATWEALGLSTLSNGTVSLTFVSLENCTINNGIRCIEEDVTQYGGGMLYQINGFGNNIGNSDIHIYTTDSVDYSNRIHLVKYNIDNT